MWNLSGQCQQAFDRLKELLIQSPVLCFPDFSRPFVLETDASGTGLGAVLAQEQTDGTIHPIAYASRSLQKHEQNYGITELEGLGVVWVVKHFRVYLYGHKCTVVTDHEALKSLLNTPQPSGKLARWGMALQDALSRCPLPESDDAHTTEEMVAAGIGEITDQERGTYEELGEQQLNDPELVPLMEYLQTGDLPQEEKLAQKISLSAPLYTLLDGILYRIEQDATLRVIPPNSLREQLFTEIHGGHFGAHLGEVKVYSVLKRHYWWSGMRRDVAKWTRACLTCATGQSGRK